MKHRFHICALPHTQTTQQFSSCAFNEKVHKFAKVMHARGHTIYLYAGEQNEAPCTEHIVCISEAERAACLNGGHYTTASFDASKPHWVKYNRRCADEISARAKEGDFILLIGGYAQKPVCDRLQRKLRPLGPNPVVPAVEFGIGYAGNFAPFRVFESYAWMHTCYGAQSHNNPNGVDPPWFDAVIPGFVDEADFPFSHRREDYLLFMGRMIDRKGVNIAIEVAKHSGRRLITAGPGQCPPGLNGEKGDLFLGPLDPVRRSEWMSRAYALICPTIYIEPFRNGRGRGASVRDPGYLDRLGSLHRDCGSRRVRLSLSNPERVC
jgi:glycosyltransferase involved in cell wall biosynthesis